jgi:DNA-binding response OmpR family regulator
MNPERQQAFDQNLARGFSVVLLVDDDPVILNLFLHVLQHASYAVLVAADGRDAIELSRVFDGHIDILITDMEMPRLGGDELGEMIMRERPGIRILQISGRVAEHFLGRNLSLAFLHKPFTPSELIEKVHEVMMAPSGTVRALTKVADV